MASRPVYPPSGVQETPRSEVDLDLALHLQELEINNLKDTVANQKDAIADHREGSKDLREAVKDLRHVIKNLRERNGDLQELNSHLAVKNAAHIDQRDKLQETKIELAELRDDHVELNDNFNRDKNLIEGLKAKVKQQDGIINGLKRHNDAVDSKQRFTIVELTVAIKAKDEAFQTLNSEHERLQATYATTTSDHGAAIRNSSASRMALEEELEELKDELKELRDYYEGNEEVNGGSEDKIKEQDETIAELNAKVQELTGFLRDSTRQVHRWFDEAQEECDNHEKSQKEVKKRDETIGWLKWEVHEHSETIAKLEKQLVEAKKSEEVGLDVNEVTEAYTRELQERNDEIANLQEHGITQKMGQKSVNELKKLRIKVKECDAALVGLKRQVQQKEKKIHRLESKLHDLEDPYWTGVA
ncbi:uncharacterized protein J4E87_010455 [Alternaria ethzedia]|uniref:uncharacterized protein n=1 Tax=Alternaria ethzedia TaxID=181014 RepID=UPI0020C5706B|nr:uncharacterized protein J4E87_010455 [Alternaria ethzedia]KAI4611605.1 hypothetical protein J4E87_010455 [Alternaria ethzedia]